MWWWRLLNSRPFQGLASSSSYCLFPFFLFLLLCITHFPLLWDCLRTLFYISNTYHWNNYILCANTHDRHTHRVCVDHVCWSNDPLNMTHTECVSCWADHCLLVPKRGPFWEWRGWRQGGPVVTPPRSRLHRVSPIHGSGLTGNLPGCLWYL